MWRWRAIIGFLSCSALSLSAPQPSTLSPNPQPHQALAFLSPSAPQRLGPSAPNTPSCSVPQVLSLCLSASQPLSLSAPQPLSRKHLHQLLSPSAPQTFSSSALGARVLNPRQKGVELLMKSAEELKTLPTVTLKIAVDSNGAVDDLGLEAKRFTSAESLDAVHRLRRDSDAVLVGIGTVARDNPSLTVRRVPLFDNQEQPARVVLDPSLRISAISALLTDGYRTFLCCAEDATVSKELKSCCDKNPALEVIKLSRLDDSGSLNLTELLGELKLRGISELMVEGGPATAASFLRSKLVDRAIIITAPMAFEIEPVPSNIEQGMLEEAGLELLSKHGEWGPDEVKLWIRPGLEWPNTKDPNAWP